MGQKVSVNNLADAIMAELEAFEEITEERFEQIAKDVAREGVKKLKQTSPKGKGTRKGHYADGWTVKYTRTGIGKFSFTIHNRKKPGLTHLLEKGHQFQQGGRAKAIVHIRPVEEWCNREFERRVKRELEGG